MIAGTRQLRSQDPVSVHAHSTEGVTESEGREGANGGGIGDGNGVGNGSGNGNGDGGERTNAAKWGRGREQGRGWRPSEYEHKIERGLERGWPSHHAEDQSPGTGDEGQDRGGRRSEEAQESSQEEL